jgi:hypothetical protein
MVIISTPVTYGSQGQQRGKISVLDFVKTITDPKVIEIPKHNDIYTLFKDKNACLKFTNYLGQIGYRKWTLLDIGTLVWIKSRFQSHGDVRTIVNQKLQALAEFSKANRYTPICQTCNVLDLLFTKLHGSQAMAMDTSG